MEARRLKWTVGAIFVACNPLGLRRLLDVDRMTATATLLLQPTR